jgi:hypothetical protein
VSDIRSPKPDHPPPNSSSTKLGETFRLSGRLKAGQERENNQKNAQNVQQDKSQHQQSSKAPPSAVPMAGADTDNQRSETVVEEAPVVDSAVGAERPEWRREDYQ